MTAATTTTWLADAACRNHDPELWFAPQPSGQALHGNWDDARTICATCPVQTPCLDAALAAGEAHGMWGGLDPDERAYLAKRRGIKPPRRKRHDAPTCGTEGGHKAHRRRGEQACPPCLAALARAQRERSAARREEEVAS